MTGSAWKLPKESDALDVVSHASAELFLSNRGEVRRGEGLGIAIGGGGRRMTGSAGRAGRFGGLGFAR